MKYGIYYSYWEESWGADFVKYIEKVSKLGFDVLEINASALFDYSDNKINEVKKIINDNNIILTAGYGPIAEHNIGNINTRNKALDWYKKVFSVMQKLDIHIICGAIYSYWPVDYSIPVQKERDWEYAVQHVRSVGRIAADYGINYCLEVLNRFEGYLLNTADEAIQFVEQVNLPAVKVMLDTFHMNIEETSMITAICQTGPLLGHFHVGENNRRLPGFGKLPWLEIGNALKSINYQGAVVMEPFVIGTGEIAHDVRLWRNIASSEELDKDAGLSLSYLKNIFS